MAQTALRLCDPARSEATFGATYDGVLILFDEGDKASKELSLGAFLKMLLERVQRHGCSHLMVGIAGLANLRDVLYASHESSLRLFDALTLDRLSKDDVDSVIDRCLASAKERNEVPTSIDDSGRSSRLSEGYPHFIQQLGYCAFDQDDDGVITQEDVSLGAGGQGGAIELIGDRYYRDDFYNRIQKDSYRSVLRIMSLKFDDWITKKEIRESFNGKETTLDNAIHALRSRNIIHSKEGTRGVYRLQNKAFALWITLYTADSTQVPLSVNNDGPS